MPDPARKPKIKPKITSPRRFRSQQFYVEIRPGEHFRVRKTDLPSLMMEGVLPTQLLHAVERFDKFREDLGKRGNLADALGKIANDPRNWQDIGEMMRRCAVAFVIEPKLTHSKRQALDSPDEYLWVGGVSDVDGDDQSREQDGDIPRSELLTFWRALMGEVGVFVMSDEDADEFRGSESGADAEAVRALGTTASAAVEPGPAIDAGNSAPAAVATEATADAEVAATR